MPTRNQLTDERVRELIKELGEAGIIHEDEAEGLATTHEFNEAREVRKETSEPPAVSREKVTHETHERFATALESGNTNEALVTIWEVLTGVDVSEGEHEDL
ncbi:hypothetical protein HAPG_00025 [Halorubrum phage GNf2]|nr:hypothetical protein HAPG_00025 [Halorubrum phage GNf2]